MAFCPQCYQSPPLCDHGVTPGNACCLFTPEPSTVRLASGDYPQSMRVTLPGEMRTLDARNIDSVIGYTKPIPATEVLIAEETAIANDFTTVAFNNVGHALSLGEKRPAHLRSVRTAILNLLNTATTQAHSAICQNGLQELDRLNTRQAASALTNQMGQVTTTTAYQQGNYPKATMFQTVVKAVEKGTEAIAPTEATYLDASSGKLYVPFEKSTKVTSAENFMYCMSIFITTLTCLTKEAPFVYYSLQKEMKRACLGKGHVAAQAYMDAFLRTMDMGIFTNPLSIIAAGEHNRLYDEVMAGFPAKQKELRDKGELSKDPLDPRRRITFGKVTTPMGGKGAGVINDWTTGNKTKCNRFHSTPQKECSAGVPAGDPRFKADQVGLCAYLH